MVFENFIKFIGDNAPGIYQIAGPLFNVRIELLEKRRVFIR
jgi:hypothetical protein